MSKRRKSVAPQRRIEVLEEQVRQLQEQVRQMRQAFSTTIQVVDTDRYITPIQGEIVIHLPPEED